MGLHRDLQPIALDLADKNRRGIGTLEYRNEEARDLARANNYEPLHRVERVALCTCRKGSDAHQTDCLVHQYFMAILFRNQSRGATRVE